MNPLICQLVQSVLKKKSLDECSIQELQQLADQYPYFGAAQLLLAEKMKSENSSQYKEQLQKASLFFQNPLWLDHLLNDTGKAEIIRAQQTETTLPKEIKTVSVDLDMPETIETELTFEPFHTVDYFASQGIKIGDEEKPNDKLELQLKSFTEWLKTLKRLPVAEIVKSVDNHIEQKVEQLAQHSIKDREVVTEAMAEVWEKQGNNAKAIEIYSKLSLLNPSKNSYFAARIEQLKK
jgi:tetratricopeptide (TPR) repeat protein